MDYKTSREPGIVTVNTRVLEFWSYNSIIKITIVVFIDE